MGLWVSRVHTGVMGIIPYNGEPNEKEHGILDGNWGYIGDSRGYSPVSKYLP